MTSEQRTESHEKAFDADEKPIPRILNSRGLSLCSPDPWSILESLTKEDS